MNSVLQCLAHTPPLAEAVLNGRAQCPASSSSSDDPLAITLAHIRRVFSSHGIVRPAGEAKVLRTVNKRWVLQAPSVTAESSPCLAPRRRLCPANPVHCRVSWCVVADDESLTGGELPECPRSAGLAVCDPPNFVIVTLMRPPSPGQNGIHTALVMQRGEARIMKACRDCFGSCSMVFPLNSEQSPQVSPSDMNQL